MPEINTDIITDEYQPRFFRLNHPTEKIAYQELTNSGRVLFIHDQIEGQLKELIKCLNPALKLKADDYPELIEKHFGAINMHDYGVWVYYPWSKRLVHLLDEEEFIEVRTNRNRNKISKEEQEMLRTKKIGIAGLSVGQSVALTLAMERTCGELRLADFDSAELSNLNRLRTGVHHLGLKKTVIAAREIMEIDPFIKIRVFEDGLNSSNLDQFFTQDGYLDVFVEVCDSLEVKIESRFKARQLKIPVIMDTNDRGMVDIERFDLEPERPLLHGLADDLDPVKVKNLSNEEKIPYILKIVGADTLSTRLKISIAQIGKTINTWPQLASSVVLGGAVTTDVCRRILLDEFTASGRYYVDFEELINS